MNDSENDCEHIKMPQSVPRGLLWHVIPRLLRSKEMSGTEMIQKLNEFSDGEWNPSPGTIYPLLSSLETDGIIETVREEGRSKIYRLTESGRKRIVIPFRRKGQVGHKTRLGARIWERILDPSERIQFHLHGMDHGVEALASLVGTTNKKDQQRLLKGLIELEQSISEIISKLESGGT